MKGLITDYGFKWLHKLSLGGVGDMDDGEAHIQQISKAYRGDCHEVIAIDGIDLAIKQPASSPPSWAPPAAGRAPVRIVAGLAKPTQGLVRLDGRTISGPGQDRGMVFQSYTLFPWLTVKENIEFGLDLSGVDRPRQEQVAQEFVEKVGLRGFERT